MTDSQQTSEDYVDSAEYMSVEIDGLCRDLAKAENGRLFWRWYSFWATIVIIGKISMEFI